MKKWIISIIAVLGSVLVIFGINMKIKESASIAVLGGADGPTAIFLAGKVGDGTSIGIIAIGIALVAVAYGFNPEGGSLNYRFSTYDSHSELYHALRMSKGFQKPVYSYFLRAESFYNIAS